MIIVIIMYRVLRLRAIPASNTRGRCLRFLNGFPLPPRRRSVFLQPERLHPHHLHLSVSRAAEGGDDGPQQPAQLRLLPGGPAVSPVGAAVPLHPGSHRDGGAVREDALAGQPEEHQLGGAARHPGGGPAQVQHQVGGAEVHLWEGKPSLSPAQANRFPSPGSTTPSWAARRRASRRRWRW